MEIKGKYKKSVSEFYNCTLLIENGLIHRVLVPDAKPIEYFTINPKDNADFEYYKLPTKKGLAPYEANYKLQYNNESGGTNSIYIKLNKSKSFCLNWQKRKYWIQKTDNWVKFLIPIVTGVSVFLITKRIFGC